MSDLIAGYHRGAAAHHKAAAEHHEMAASEYEKTDDEGYDEEVAAAHAHNAHGHALHAIELMEDAVKEHCDNYGADLD